MAACAVLYHTVDETATSPSSSAMVEPPRELSKPATGNGPRPHRCNVCQRSFREVATLRKHEQLHRADRPYVCLTCGKSFLWSSNLKVHERVHTGERPYKCKICHRCFTQSNDLRRHERNVHMRGKIYGYKNTGRQSSQVNLAAYQAFAMQQRALLQQALSYESYLQKSGQVAAAAQLFHHSQGLAAAGVGTARLVGPGTRPGEGQPGAPPRSPLKLEQVTPPSTPSESETNGLDKRPMGRLGSPHMADGAVGHLHSPGRTAGMVSIGQVGLMPSPPGMLNAHYSPAAIKENFELPQSRASGLPAAYNNFRPMQRSLESLPGMPLTQRQQAAGNAIGGPGNPQENHLLHPSLRHSHEMLHLNIMNTSGSDHNSSSNSSSNINNYNGNHNTGSNNSSNHNHISPGGNSSRSNMSPRSPRPVSPFQQHDRSDSREGDRIIYVDGHGIKQEADEDGHVRERANSADYSYMSLHSQSQGGSNSGGIYPDKMSRSAPPPLTSVSEDTNLKRHHSHDLPPPLPPHHNFQLGDGHHSHLHQALLDKNNINNNNNSYPCDSVMDLSINKSSASASPPSRSSSNSSSTAADKEVSLSMPPPKTHASIGGNESESEPGKRDVTTTSATPTADSGGIHHCHHCNIFFYDFTMFHLHESLHLPYEDDPFRCPSCGTHCQDKIEFMFHTVWHVKYPHTIPNYTPFREGIMSSP